MTSQPKNMDKWAATIPTVSQVLHLAYDLCQAIPSGPDFAISDTHRAQARTVIQNLNGPECQISWKQTIPPLDQTDSATFTLFPSLPLELRFKIWAHACDDLRFPGALGIGIVPMRVYGEPLGVALACRESNSVLKRLMTKCPVCSGTWFKLTDIARKRHGCSWRDGMVFVKGSKIPCASCNVLEGSGDISMRMRYIMHYGNCWNNNKYYSSFCIMGRRTNSLDFMTFIVPQFSEDLNGKGYLRKIAILQEKPDERAVHTTVLASDLDTVG